MKTKISKKEQLADMADLCEEAHSMTVKECKKKHIKFETVRIGADTRYTDKAQIIFNKYYDKLVAKYNI